MPLKVILSLELYVTISQTRNFCLKLVCGVLRIVIAHTCACVCVCVCAHSAWILSRLLSCECVGLCGNGGYPLCGSNRYLVCLCVLILLEI